MSKLTELKIAFTRKEGRTKHTIKAYIDLESGDWHQWGAPMSVLGDNVDMLTAIRNATLDALPASDEP